MEAAAAEEEEEEEEEEGEEEEEEDDDGSASESDPATPPPRDPLPSRGTRGRRMTALIDEQEQEADEAFWGQDFFAEEAGDAEFEATSESEDVADSDFSDDENDMQGDAGEGEAADKALLREERQARAVPKPPSRKQAAATAARRRATDSMAGPHEAAAAAPKPRAPREPKPPPELAEMRKSLRTKVLERAHERAAAAAAAAAEKRSPKAAGAKNKRKADGADFVPPMTQAELLAEAAVTEQVNLASLAELLAREEATKKRAAVKRAVYTGPIERFKSVRGAEGPKNTLLFLGHATLVEPPPPAAAGGAPEAASDDAPRYVRRAVAAPSPPFGRAPPPPASAVRTRRLPASAPV